MPMDTLLSYVKSRCGAQAERSGRVWQVRHPNAPSLMLRLSDSSSKPNGFAASMGRLNERSPLIRWRKESLYLDDPANDPRTHNVCRTILRGRPGLLSKGTR